MTLTKASVHARENKKFINQKINESNQLFTLAPVRTYMWIKN